MGILSLAIISCDGLFSDGNIPEAKNNGASSNSSVTSVRLSSSSITVKVGDIAYLGFTMSGGYVTPSWDYNSSVISCQTESQGIIITGISEGQSPVTIRCGDKSATCIVTVSGYSDNYIDTTEPYIYSSTTVTQMETGDIQTLCVSLYNGTAADIDGYAWSVDNPSVIDLTPTGQYCQIKAKTTGFAKITVRHSKSAYPYYIGVYVFADITKATYITTTSNVVISKLADGDKKITCDLKNPQSENYKTGFSWRVIENNSGEDKSAIMLTANADTCYITPVKSGICTVEVTHPECTYPLYITVRVIEIVQNVYIEPSRTVVTISGSVSETVSADLVGLDEGSEYSPDDFTWEWEASSDDCLTYYSSGNEIHLSGTKNGSASLLIGHPKAAKKRQVLIIVQDQSASAVDSSFYITTSQNYVKTKVGLDETAVNISLKGGTDGDEANFHWQVIQNPDDGVSDVIKLETANGTSSSTIARMAIATYVYGTAYITPVNPGTATIRITHPKAAYPTEILVKVLDKNALLEQPYYFKGDSLVKFLNSENYSYSIMLNGSSDISTADENDIQFHTESTALNINASGARAQLSSNKTGSNVSTMVVTHPKVEAQKNVLVLTADTYDELNNIRAFYADKSYYSLNKGRTTLINVNTVGFYGSGDGDSYSPFDFSPLTWTSDNPSVASVERLSDCYTSATVTGNATGTCHITASYYNEASYKFTVTVYPEDVSIGVVEKTVYLTTTQNVVNLSSAGLEKTVSVSAINIPSSELYKMTWTSSDENVCTAVSNGSSATFKAIGEGEAVVTVDHPLSENTLKIYVRVGSEYIITNEPVCYISTSPEIIAVTKDAQIQKLTCVLVNDEGKTPGGFSYSIEDSGIANITSTDPTGTVYIKPVNAGQTELTVKHSKAEYDKKVLIVIANSNEELSAFKYITTATNVVSIGQGSTKSISVTMMNSQDPVVSGYCWTAETPSVASVTETGTNTAVISANSTGTAKIKVTHSECSYPLEIIIQVVDPKVASACPYIQVNNPVITLIEGDTSWTNLSAELVGGTEDDQKQIQWTASSDIVTCYGQNGIGYIKGRSTGTCYVTVSHSKAVYEQKVLCIVESKAASDYSITLSSSNILKIKPDDKDGETIIATLVNGTAADKANFTWSLDVYDIVDITYASNQCEIIPLKQGTCKLTVSHPKSAYDQIVSITVQQYDSFSFAADRQSIMQGATTFVSMQTPTSSVPTHVEYETANPNVVTISGTSSVCQLTAVGAGTTTVKAKLVATRTNEVTATSDMLVYVEKASDNTTYITTTSTIVTIEKGASKTISASLTGGNYSITDNYNLQWKSSDPNIVKLANTSTTGISVGQSAYLTAVSSGECTITVTSDLCNTNLVIYCIVPGETDKTISLDKTYAKIEKSQTTTLKATISDGENSDYQNIIWTADRPNGEEVVRVMGEGKQPTIFGVNAGICWVNATLPGGQTARCQVEVVVPSSLTFESTTIRVNPGKSRTIKYTVTPANDRISNYMINTQTGEDCFSYVDNGIDQGGQGSITIEGIKAGSGQLICTTESGVVSKMNITVAWDYTFNIDKSIIEDTPDKDYEVNFKVSPVDAEIILESTSIANCTVVNNNDGTGKILIKPVIEGTDTFKIMARNPHTTDNIEFGSKQIKLDLRYSRLTVATKLNSSTGNFSYISDDGQIFIGDGEEVTLDFAIKETKADGEITDIKFEKTQNTQNKTTLTQFIADAPVYSTTGLKMILNHTVDYNQYRYRITTGYRPGSYKGKNLSLSDFRYCYHFDDFDCNHGFGNWNHGGDNNRYYGIVTHYSNSSFDYAKGRNDFAWESCSEGRAPNSKVFNDYGWAYLEGAGWNSSYTKVRDESLDDTIMSKEEFEQYVWYYYNGSIMICNISAQREPSDDTIRESYQIGTLVYTVKHGSKTETNRLTVNYQRRDCAKNY